VKSPTGKKPELDLTKKKFLSIILQRVRKSGFANGITAIK
jgi:hypothetical protein